MKKWTGKDIKDLRKRLSLSRKKFAALLNVSAPTIEKWEHPDSLNKPIREKYLQSLEHISNKLGDSSSLLKAGVSTISLINPLSALSLLGLGTKLASDLSNKNIDKALRLLEKLKELSPSEREKFVKILLSLEDNNL